MRATHFQFQATLVLAAFLVLPATVRAQVRALETQGCTLSPNAWHSAQIIGIGPLVTTLSSLPATQDRAPRTVEELSLRQRITEAVVVASLDVDSVLEEIDNEQAQIIELQSILLARRQRAVGTTNLATLALSTGLGALSGVLQFSDTTKGAGNIIGFAAGGISTLLSFHSMRQQHTGKRPTWVLPSMLAPLLREPQEQHTTYPPDVWAYLNNSRCTGALEASKRAHLLEQWLGAERFPPLDSPQAKAKTALLTSSDAADKRLNMDLLAERAAMLADVRSVVSMMKRDLSDLLRGISACR